MKIIIAPDKFKGSLTSMEVCLAIREGIHKADKTIDTLLFPLADGGDGFAAVMKYYTGTISQEVQSVDALGRLISSHYEWDPVCLTAIIELAACSGLAMLKKEERDPLITSTYGTGLQIKDAVQRGAGRIILGVGGSATNDAGMGILYAMGFRFYGKTGISLKPCGQSLLQVRKIIPPATLPSLQFEIACDVNNPLFGPEGAAIIFSPQKGATPGKAILLDKGLEQFAKIVQQQTGTDVSKFPGAGAAGGIAAGLKAFLPVTMAEGTKLILRASKMESFLTDVNLIITGEGKIDQQSFRGKTVSAITSIGNERNIPVVAICGKLDLGEPECTALGLSLAVEITQGSLTEQESMQRAHELLSKKAESILSLFKKIYRKYD